MPLITQSLDVKINGEMYRVKLLFSVNSSDPDYWTSMKTDEFNYFCYNQQNRITCWPIKNGRPPLNEKGQWKTEGRQEIKPGKFLMSFINYVQMEDASGYQVKRNTSTFDRVLLRVCEVFTARVQGANAVLEYKISDKPGVIYKMMTYRDSGNLTNSCMRPDSGHGCRHYSNFYNEIPNLKIVYGDTPDGYLLYRALLWENVETHDGQIVKFLDRPYASESLQQKLINIATENDWAWRYFSDSNVKYLDRRGIGLHTILPRKAALYLQNTGSPYGDTMNQIANEGSKFTISNYRANPYGSYYTMQDCYGGPLDLFPKCPYCSCVLNSRNTKNLDGTELCRKCYVEHSQVCGTCGSVHLNDNRNRDGKGKIICRSCIRNLKLRSCAGCNCYHPDSELLYSSDANYSYCIRCYERYHKNCVICGESHQKTDYRSSRVDNQVSDKICGNCLSEFYFQCRNCSRCFSGYLRFRGYSNLRYCDHCLDIARLDRYRYQEIPIAYHPEQTLRLPFDPPIEMASPIEVTVRTANRY